MSFWIRAGAASMLLAVAAGAFGAHALKNRLGPEMLSVFETAARYQVYHALGLFIVGWLVQRGFSGGVERAGACFLAGTVLFSGSLYALSLTGARKLGMITPVGGLLFLLGWALIAFARP